MVLKSVRNWSLTMKPQRATAMTEKSNRPQSKRLVRLHVHDPDLAGGLLVLLRRERILDLPDAGELVVVIDLDGRADEPRVARVGLQAARQAHDPIPAPGPGELGAPPEPVPILEERRGEGHLDAAVVRRPDVLQDRRVSGRGRDLPQHQQVAGVRLIVVHGARDAAAARGEFEYLV